jgi:hypothetical protein
VPASVRTAGARVRVALGSSFKAPTFLETFAARFLSGTRRIPALTRV